MLSCSIMSKSLQPHELWPSRLLCPWDFPGKNTGVGCHFPLQGIFLTQGLNPQLLHWQADSLPSESPGEPKNAGVRSLFLFQGIFPTQELNRGLLHCRWILYQLSYKGSPYIKVKDLKLISLKLSECLSSPVSLDYTQKWNDYCWNLLRCMTFTKPTPLRTLQCLLRT